MFVFKSGEQQFINLPVGITSKATDLGYNVMFVLFDDLESLGQSCAKVSETTV